MPFEIAKVNPKEQKYPFCIVWTPIPFLRSEMHIYL